MSNYQSIQDNLQGLKENDLCPRCKTPLILRTNKLLTTKRQRQYYHYCKWLKCLRCRAVFMLDEWRREPGQECDCKKENIEEDYSVKIPFDCLKTKKTGVSLLTLFD